MSEGHVTASPSAGNRRWLRALLEPWPRRVALVGFIAVAFMPIEGLGHSFDFCPIHRATGLPCPGCGMTRAMAAVSQGHFDLALGANPFVVMVGPFLLLLALPALMPQRTVWALEQRLDAFEPWLSRAFQVCLFAFLGFGVARFVLFLVLRESFP